MIMKNYPLLSILVIVVITALTGCGFNQQHNVPPAQQMMHPGPGVDGPGPAVMMPTMDGVVKRLTSTKEAIAYLSSCVGPGGFRRV